MATIATPAPSPKLGLDLRDLDELLCAIGDREDLAGPEARERLARARQAVEADAGHLIEQAPE